MRNLPARYPVLFCLAITLVSGYGQMWPFLLPGLPTAQVALLGKLAVFLFAIGLVAWLGWWRKVGLHWPGGWRPILPYLPLFLIPLLNLGSIVGAGTKVADPSLIAIGALVYLLGGFVEEVVSRGAVTRVLQGRRSLMRAAVLSSAIFGAAHLLDLLAGQDPIFTVAQCLWSALLGFAFVAPFLYTGTVWPGIVAHALTNFAGYLATGEFVATSAPSVESLIAVYVLVTPLVVYGYWLLGRVGRVVSAAPTERRGATA